MYRVSFQTRAWRQRTFVASKARKATRPLLWPWGVAMATVKWMQLLWWCSFEVKFGGLFCVVGLASSDARFEVNAIALVVLSFIEVPRCQVDIDRVFHSSVVLSGAARAVLLRCGCRPRHWL